MKTEQTCYYCKHLCSYGYHHWGCRLKDQTTQADNYCPEWEEDK